MILQAIAWFIRANRMASAVIAMWYSHLLMMLALVVTQPTAAAPPVTWALIASVYVGFRLVTWYARLKGEEYEQKQWWKE